MRLYRQPLVLPQGLCCDEEPPRQLIYPPGHCRKYANDMSCQKQPVTSPDGCCAPCEWSTSDFGSDESYRKLYSAFVNRLYSDLNLGGLGVEIDDVSVGVKVKPGPNDFASCKGVAGATFNLSSYHQSKARCVVVNVVILQVASKRPWFSSDLRKNLASYCQLEAKKHPINWGAYTFQSLGCQTALKGISLATEASVKAVFFDERSRWQYFTALEGGLVERFVLFDVDLSGLVHRHNFG